MKRALITAALACAVTLHGITAADAAEYPASPAQGGVDTGTVAPGGSVEFDGGGMTPGEQVTVTITCTDGAGGTTTESAVAVADAAGNFSYTATLGSVGACILTAAGSAAVPITAQVTVTEVPSAPAGSAATGPAAGGTPDASQALAATGVGAPLLVWGAVGLGALGLGTLAVATAGRRTPDQEAL